MRLFSKRQVRSSTSQGKRFRPALEVMGDRLVPSVSFSEFHVGSSHHVIINGTNGQKHTVTNANDGQGNIRVTADGVVRNFTAVTNVFYNGADRVDTVTYNQGTSTQGADNNSDFFLHVGLGANRSGTTDRFTANVFGDVKHTLGLIVDGGAGRDRIDINANHDTDVSAGAKLIVRVLGEGGNDNITIDYDGELDGKLDLLASGGDDNDLIAANVNLDAGST